MASAIHKQESATGVYPCTPLPLLLPPVPNPSPPPSPSHASRLSQTTGFGFIHQTPTGYAFYIW